MPKPEPLISPKHWTARRPDGQTADTESNPAPTVKGSGNRPGVERIEVRVPTQKGRKFKQLCHTYGWEQKDVIETLLDYWFTTLDGRPDGQTARDQIKSDLILDPDLKNDDEVKFITPSSSHDPGRPDGQSLAVKRQKVLAYYVRFTGNPIRQNDRDFLETILDYPQHVIECGIAKSVYLCKTPAKDPHVGSLRYCEGAIQEMAEAEIGADYARYMETALDRAARGWDPTIRPKLPPNAFPPKQPALPGASEAGELIELPRKDLE